jgi:hypothetical protein
MNQTCELDLGLKQLHSISELRAHLRNMMIDNRHNISHRWPALATLFPANEAQAFRRQMLRRLTALTTSTESRDLAPQVGPSPKARWLRVYQSRAQTGQARARTPKLSKSLGARRASDAMQTFTRPPQSVIQQTTHQICFLFARRWPCNLGVFHPLPVCRRIIFCLLFASFPSLVPHRPVQRCPLSNALDCGCGWPCTEPATQAFLIPHQRPSLAPCSPSPSNPFAVKCFLSRSRPSPPVPTRLRAIRHSPPRLDAMHHSGSAAAC